jgi:MFS family permease
VPVEFKKDIKILLRNRSYICLTISFTFLYGVYTALGAVVSSITAPYGYVASENSLFGAIFIIAGVLGSFVFGVVLDRFNKYKLILTLLGFSSIVTVSISMLALPSKSVVFLSGSLALVGISVIPVIPVSYGFAVELTYPMAESLSNGMMVMVSQIFGFFVVSYLIFINSHRELLLQYCVAIALSIVFLCLLFVDVLQPSAHYSLKRT